MKAVDSAVSLPDALAEAERRITELEAENARLRSAVEQNGAAFSMPPNSILESITDCFIALDKDFHYIWINSETERVFGLERQSLIGKTIWDIFPDLVGTVGYTSLKRAMEDRLCLDFEQLYEPWQRWFYSRAYPIKEGGLALYTREITEQKRAQDEARESNTLLKFQADILASTNDAVIALDSDLCIRYCNAAAERIYGTRLEDVKGKPMIAMHGYAFLNKEDEHNTIEALKQGSWKGEYIHILNDGSKIVVQSTVNVLPPEAGGGMVAIIRDVTQRKQEEIKAKHQAEQLARANEDLLHFAYAVSHDLHAPLRTITSFSQLLAMKCGQNLGKDGSEFIRWIVEASTRMDTMLRDLLRFATVAGGEAEFSQNVSLLETLSTALAGLRIQIEETQAVITHDDLPEIAGDPGQLVQLFQNLIGNSLKYRRPDTFPQIHVSAERKEDEWVVHVRDNGLGFEDKHSERIFGVFQRLHDKEFAGTGIGLTICKRIAERRGGRIWAEGRPLEGATFSFSIPDSTIAVQSAPAMDWGNVRAALVSRPAQEDGSGAFSHFGELFKLLDLAQAVVRTLDGSILIWTKGAERLFGWTEAEAVGKPLRELIKPDFGVLPVDIEATLLRDGEWIGELKVQRCDGSVIWLASHKILYRDGSGRPQSVIEIHNNITALKEAEAALARSMVQRDLALNAAQMGIWRWDCRSGVVEWSDILESMLGMPPGAFEGTFDAFKARIHPDDWPETEQVINEGLASKGSYFVENRLQRVDGSYCWVRGQGKVVFDDANQPAGLIGVVYDISHRKQREADRQFLLDLSAKTARIASAKEVAEVTVMEVARYLGVLRCVYSESDEDGKRMRVFAEYTTEGDPATDSLRLADYSGIMTDLANNQVVVVNDVATDSRTAEGYEDRFVARNIRSFVLVPLHMEGARLANIGVSFNRARVWQEREIALLHAVAQRLEATLYIARMWQQDKVRQTSV